MASLRSWLGSIFSLLVFFVLRRFMAGFALPAFLATLLACAYLWVAVLRVPQLRKETPVEEILAAAMPTAASRESTCTSGATANHASAAESEDSAAEEQEDEAGHEEDEEDAEQRQEEEAERRRVEEMRAEGAAGLPTPPTGKPQRAAPEKKRAEGPVASDAGGASSASAAAAIANSEGDASVGAPAAGDQSAARAAVGQGAGGGTDAAGAQSRSESVPKAADDEWGDESEGEEAENERRRLAEDKVADPEKAQELRQQGNDFFRAGKLHDAREAYSEALYLTPSVQEKDKAVLYGNRAACLQKLARWEDVITDCGEAIKLDKEYVKVYARRSLAYEAMERWHDALEDLKKAIELDPSIRSKEYRRMAVLEKRSADQFENDKTEMMGKLKELGNTVLGKFGMSCDNFKLEQDPNTGGYSIKYAS